MDNILTCPVCDAPLCRDGKTLKCENNHSFDISSRGYVNLLNTGVHSAGDNKTMVKARRNFLELGHYRPLSDALNQCVSGLTLDCGCGEGYYTARLPLDNIYAVDISKNAVYSACTRFKSIKWIVASAAHLPFANNSFDSILNVFAPIYPDEASRVLKPGGKLIIASPAADHLIELKRVLYDDVYLNNETPEDLTGFTMISEERVKNTFLLSSPEQLSWLVAMTPYAYRTPKNGYDRLSKLNSLQITANFIIRTWKNGLTD